MYKVLPVEGGWSVFWFASGADPRLVPHTNKVGQVVPYSKRQAAYRRSKKLNDAILGECQCGEPADIQCSIGNCAPLTKYCGYHYEQAHLPVDERD